MGSPGDTDKYLKEAPANVEAMFSGKKAGLRPLYDEILKLTTGLGEDSGRLVATGGEAKGDRITHRIGISSMKDIDREVRDWLKRAYDADAQTIQP